MTHEIDIVRIPRRPKTERRAGRTARARATIDAPRESASRRQPVRKSSSRAMRSVSGATSIAASAGRRHQSRRRALQATRRLRALRGVDGPEKVVETARKSVETFIQRVRGVAVGRVDAYRSASSARTAQASSSNTLQTLVRLVGPSRRRRLTARSRFAGVESVADSARSRG